MGRCGVIGAAGFRRSVLEAFVTDHLESDSLIDRVMSGPEGLIYSSSDGRDPCRFADSVLYRRLFWPSELLHAAGTAVVNRPKFVASLWTGRKQGRSAFSAREHQRLTVLGPHFGRALSVHHRLKVAEMQVDLATGAFDCVAVGVVLLDVAGSPILANREAERIAARRDGFIVGGSFLAAENPSDSRALRELIGRVGRQSSSGQPGARLGGVAPVEAPDVTSGYHEVVPGPYRLTH